MKKFIICTILSGTLGIAHADLATINYVNDTKSDWNQNNQTAPNYIKNKPEIINSIESNKTFTDTTIPTANAVKSALESKASSNDTRFDTIPTQQPKNDPPAGRAQIWVE